MSADYCRVVPTIDLTDAELAAVTAVIRGVIATDKYPHAPRLVPLRMAPAKFDAAAPEPTPAAEGPATSQSRQAGAVINAR
jgi:hypothetical protein